MSKNWRFLALLLIFSQCAAAFDFNNLQVGDLIFHKSQSQQSAAISEATKSPWTHVGVIIKKPNDLAWYVAEARLTSLDINTLDNFVNRGIGQEFVVKRFSNAVLDMSNSDYQAVLVDTIMAFGGQKYDIFFEWSNKAIYCSELPWKAYRKAFMVMAGNLQEIGELDLTGPNIRKLVEAREAIKGSPINLSEPIITPIRMMDSPSLITVN